MPFLWPLAAARALSYAGHSASPWWAVFFFQALSSTGDCQILCATHSPVFLSLAVPKQILCFARTDEGATDIVSGEQHPRLAQWKRETDLGTIFAAGLLG